MNQTRVYQDNAVTTQSPGGLVVMLYDGAIKFLNQAIAELEAGNMGEKGRYLGKATDIIIELNNILDMGSGAEVAANLRRLYDFMIRHLTQANFKKDPQMIREVIVLLEDINQGWKAIAE